MKFIDRVKNLFGRNKNYENPEEAEGNKRAKLQGSTRVVKEGRINNRELRRSARKALGKKNYERNVKCTPMVLWMLRQAGVVQRGQRRVRPSTVLAFIRSQTKPGAA